MLLLIMQYSNKQTVNTFGISTGPPIPKLPSVKVLDFSRKAQFTLPVGLSLSILRPFSPVTISPSISRFRSSVEAER